MTEQKTNNCLNCVHYYVTWDKNYPKGCKGFGFKSATIPFQLVKEVSGETCKLYEPRK